MYRRPRKRVMGRKPSFEVGGVVKDIREDYPPVVKSFLEAHGDEVITSIKVDRTPVSGAVKGVLNIVSLGALKKAIKKAGIDELFHLYLVINGKYRIEKNQVIYMGPYKPSKNETSFDIPFDRKDLTIGEFIENGVKYAGKTTYFTYGAFGPRNCQGFVLANLRGNNIKNIPNDFIVQNVDAILENTPGYLPKITNAITDVAGVLDLFKQKLRRLLPFEYGGLVV